MKSIFNLILFSLFISNCFSQVTFQRAIGGIGNDNLNSIIHSTDGGFILGGYTSSFGAGGNDFYIVKCDSNIGTIQWSRTIGGAGLDVGLSVTKTSDGGCAVSGETLSFGAGNYDAYLVKLDRNGTKQWSRTIGGTGEDYGESVIQTSDGGYAIGGETNSFGAGDYEMYIVKLDSSGSIQWSETIGETGYDYALWIIQTTDGGYALFGSTDSFGEGGEDYFIVKLSSSGALQWSRTIWGTGGDYGFCIIQTTDGGYAMSGTTASFGVGYIDIYVVKLDNNGAFQWGKTFGGSNYDYGYSIIQTTDGGYAVAGTTNSFGAGNYDAYILKLDGRGNLQWSKTVGGANDDDFLSIKQTPDGGYVAAGHTNSFGEGNSDIFVVKFDGAGNTCGNSSSPLTITGSGGTTTSPTPIVTNAASIVTIPSDSISSGGIITPICVIGIKPISNEIPKTFALEQNYPNPFNPTTKIKFNTPPQPSPKERGQNVKLIIYDILGNKVSTLVNDRLSPGMYEVEFDGSNFASGVYFYKLEIRDAETKETLKQVQGDGSALYFSETRKMVLVK